MAPSSPTTTERPKPFFGVAALAFAIGLCALVVNGLATGLSCGFDHNQCAEHGPSHRYIGRVFTTSGRTDGNATVAFDFTSEDGGGPTIRADAKGRYCLIWPLEQETPAVSLSGGKPAGRPNPEIVQLARYSRGPVIVSPDGDHWESRIDPVFNPRPSWDNDALIEIDGGGGVFALGPRIAALGTPTHCASGAPSWRRFDNATSNWRFLFTLWSALASLVLAIGACLARPIARHAAAPIALAALRVAVASALSFLLFLFI
jgi:hypothetical protein